MIKCRRTATGCSSNCWQGLWSCPHPDRCFKPDITDRAITFAMFALWLVPLLTAFCGLTAWLFL